MEKKSDGTWHHRSFIAPRRFPSKEYSKLDWIWIRVGWKEFELVPRNGAPMPDVPLTKQKRITSFVAESAKKYE